MNLNMNTTTAYDEGWDAYDKGKDLSCNPYKCASDEEFNYANYTNFLDWNEGWISAEESWAYDAWEDYNGLLD